MSRIGKMAISVPDGVTFKSEGNIITITGPKGTLSQDHLSFVKIDFIPEQKEINISVNNPESVKERPYWGLYRALVANMIKGVTTGFEKKLEYSGVGFSVKTDGKKITLNLGYSHPIVYELPEGVTAVVDKGSITISGFNKQVVGQVAAEIRKFRKVDPYKLKGIKYSDEVVIKKAGKLAKSVGK